MLRIAIAASLVVVAIIGLVANLAPIGAVPVRPGEIPEIGSCGEGFHAVTVNDSRGAFVICEAAPAGVAGRLAQ